METANLIYKKRERNLYIKLPINIIILVMLVTAALVMDLIVLDKLSNLIHPIFLS